MFEILYALNKTVITERYYEIESFSLEFLLIKNEPSSTSNLRKLESCYKETFTIAKVIANDL